MIKTGKWRIKKENGQYYPQFQERTIFGNLRWYAPLWDAGVCSVEYSFLTREEALSFIKNDEKIVKASAYEEVN